MKNPFMIGDKVQYLVGRDGVKDVYSDIVEVAVADEDSIIVTGGVIVPLKNVRRIELTRDVLEDYAKKFVHGTALLSLNDPYISYTPQLKYLCIIKDGIEVRVPCVYLDQLQHIVGGICENYELKLKDYE